MNRYDDFDDLIQRSPPIPYVVFTSPLGFIPFDARHAAIEVTAIGDAARSWLLPNGDIIHEANTGATTRLIPRCACGDELPDGATFCVMCGRPVVQ